MKDLFRPNLIIGALPVNLLNGTTADATQVMADLNFIVNSVNANAASTVNQAVTNANNNFTTVQSGQAATQPANFVIASQIENNSLQTLSSVLGTNTITARVSALALGAYVTGQMFEFIPSNANTGATTVNIDGLGARSILNMGSALSGAELQNYRSALVAFNGANAFDLVNGTPYVKGPNIQAAATLNLDGTSGDYNQVDGIASVTAVTISPGRSRLLEFTSSPLLTRSGSFILPLASNIVPTPGDTALIRGEPGGVARVVGYQRANGAALFPFSQYFESAPQVITSGGALTIPHGLNVVPRLVMCVLVNITAELGYTAGQQTFVNAGAQFGGAGTNPGLAVVPDATNLNIRMGAGVGAIGVSNFTTGGVAVITNANWSILFRAWA